MQLHITPRLNLLIFPLSPELDFLQVSSDGFPEKTTPVCLTDSIMLADLPRLRHYSSGRGPKSRDESGCGQESRDVSQTQLLLCKVFKGEHSEISSSGM